MWPQRPPEGRGLGECGPVGPPASPAGRGSPTHKALTEAPWGTPCAISFPGTPTPVLQPLEKARPKSKAPSKDSVQGLRARCQHTKPTSNLVMRSFVTRRGPEYPRPSGRGVCEGYGDPFSSPHKMTHGLPQEGMGSRRPQKE